MIQKNQNQLTIVEHNISKLRSLESEDINLSEEELEAYKVPFNENGIAQKRIDEIINSTIGEINIVKEENNTYYYICDSVYRAAELIRIKENFTSRTLKDIKIGQYTYLMGKHRMLRFVCVLGAIKGFYFDDKNNIAFEWGCLMDDGGYYFEKTRQKEFSTIMQVLTFVELGDIEVNILEGGKNNGKPKKEGKVHNSSSKTVYVVDSSWNTIIMRTTGFAVRGHFRLQPCGIGLIDRKLMWINAFEKHGYKRRPKGEIAASGELEQQIQKI